MMVYNLEINEFIFRKYDIRGKVSKGNINKETFFVIGKATGTFFRNKRIKNVIIGHDNRKSSEELKRALIKGLISTGCNVLDIGMVPTPLVYFSVIKHEYDAGCMITGSHIAPDMNGLKICIGKLSIYGKDIQKIKEIAEKNSFRKGKGIIEKKDVTEDYIKRVTKGIKLKKKLNLLIDCGNGVTGLVAPRIFDSLGINTDILYGEPDGNFPNHLPDSNKEENLKELIKLVKSKKADLGIAFDGDGDRITVVDNKGDILLGDYMLGLFFDSISRTRRIKNVVSGIKCSQSIIDFIKEKGGNVILCETGHSIIEEKMKEYHALLGGEVSGHIFFRDRYYGFDDAIYAAVRFIELLSKSRKGVNDMLKNIPKYFTSKEYRLKCPDRYKFSVVEKIKNAFKNKYEVIETDGARIIFENGWGLVRVSNTEPEISIRFESKTKSGFEKIKNILNKEIKKYPSVKGYIR